VQVTQVKEDMVMVLMDGELPPSTALTPPGTRGPL
jgi:hypothetical protein